MADRSVRPTPLVTRETRLLKIGVMRRALGILGAVLLLGLAALAQYETALLNFNVIRDYSGKPIRNASVIMHPVKKDGKQSRGGLQIKTDSEGKANFDGVPFGKLRIQVLAQGFQTYGEDYDINQPKMDITIRMKRPSEQYSIYEDHPEAKPEEKKEQKPDEKQNDKPQ
jgi:hypothetical protein